MGNRGRQGMGPCRYAGTHSDDLSVFKKKNLENGPCICGKPAQSTSLFHIVTLVFEFLVLITQYAAAGTEV